MTRAEESNLWGSSPPPRFSGPVDDHSSALSRSAFGVTGGDRTLTSSFTARRARQYTTATMRVALRLPELESNQRHRLQRPAHDLRSGKNSALVGAEGIEPPSAVCRTAALPLDETPVGAARVELAPSCSRNRRLPIKPSRRGIDSGRTTHPWFDAGRGVGVEVLPTPAALRVSLQPGDESLRARAADRHVGSVIVPRRRVERATATETAFGVFHGVLLSAFVK